MTTFLDYTAFARDRIPILKMRWENWGLTPATVNSGLYSSASCPIWASVAVQGCLRIVRGFCPFWWIQAGSRTGTYCNYSSHSYLIRMKFGAGLAQDWGLTPSSPSLPTCSTPLNTSQKMTLNVLSLWKERMGCTNWIFLKISVTSTQKIWRVLPHCCFFFLPFLDLFLCTSKWANVCFSL